MLRYLAIFIAAALLGAAAGCTMSQAKMGKNANANAVLTAHSAELMKRPGVVGVYLGLMPDEKTECIRVMLKAKEFSSGIPKQIEGIPVRLDIGGEIRPLSKN